MWQNIVDWFSKIWQSIVDFFVNGKTDTTTTPFLGKIILAIIMFFILFYLDKFIIWLIKKSMKISKEKDKSVKMAKSFVASIIKALLYVILVVIIMAILGFDLTGLSTIISSAIVAVGLALQNVIANFASGIIIISAKHLLVGDYIQVGAVSGTIRNVNILDTELVTPDNTVIYVPNSTITSSNVINYNTMVYRRINLTIGVSYGSDIDAVKKILLNCIHKTDTIVKDMPITVVLNEMSDSSMDFAVRCYVPTPVYWDTYYALNELIYKELCSRNVDIPYNQLDVNLYNSKDEEMHAKVTDIKDEDIASSPSPRSPEISREDKPDEIDSIIEKAKKTTKRLSLRRKPKIKKETEEKENEKGGK
jgi:small conductance mechanosensitive channel